MIPNLVASLFNHITRYNYLKNGILFREMIVFQLARRCQELLQPCPTTKPRPQRPQRPNANARYFSVTIWFLHSGSDASFSVPSSPSNASPFRHRSWKPSPPVAEETTATLMSLRSGFTGFYLCSSGSRNGNRLWMRRDRSSSKDKDAPKKAPGTEKMSNGVLFFVLGRFLGRSADAGRLASTCFQSARKGAGEEGTRVG